MTIIKGRRRARGQIFKDFIAYVVVEGGKGVTEIANDARIYSRNWMWRLYSRNGLGERCFVS